MWVAERRNRNTREETETAIKLLQQIPIIFDIKPVSETITATLNLARQIRPSKYSITS
ncbi:PIN domain-containing protein [Cuspidothrix issatschenkoi]|uniref:hypothetical protein n=1 Tax=Cuspidothrix issatschenkoi TaxID=230752 RepID=UPI001D1475E9|nr:hypothetical protein [Cuspidothrix issatschenkoi]